VSKRGQETIRRKITRRDQKKKMRKEVSTSGGKKSRLWKPAGKIKTPKKKRKSLGGRPVKENKKGLWGERIQRKEKILCKGQKVQRLSPGESLKERVGFRLFIKTGREEFERENTGVSSLGKGGESHSTKKNH